MTKSPLSRASNFSIVWGFTLAILTILDWNTLDRDPASEVILMPFIIREAVLEETPAASELDFTPTENEKPYQYKVAIEFNGPYFLACFFLPILAFQLIGLLLRFNNKKE
jgi:hypothetical protein